MLKKKPFNEELELFMATISQTKDKYSSVELCPVQRSQVLIKLKVVTILYLPCVSFFFFFGLPGQIWTNYIARRIVKA